MTIGGVRVSESQFAVLVRIAEQGSVSSKSINARTGGSLLTLGYAELFVPEARTYAMAARGRVRYYRLTKAGGEAVRGLRKLYDR